MSKWLLISGALLACDKLPQSQLEKPKGNIQFITVDPGHFHAALVQKSMYPEVDSTVYVYAPSGNDLTLHMNRMEGFNSRSENPTNWQSIVYEGDDFMEKMLRDKNGNTVVLAGNNQKKTEYILNSLKSGLNVYADKPMIINSDNFEMLKEAFQVAGAKDLILYDVMTERFEITTILQKELSLIPEIFGTLEKGSPENPAVTKESVHHFFKYVSGKVLTRPPWFFDVKQEGEGIVDVTTHLVDLVQWECFPNQILDYKKDIEITSAKRWPTEMTLNDFEKVTKTKGFPEYLKSDIKNDTLLQVYSNGEINYRLKDVHAKVSVIWAYQAPEGAGDTHYSIMRGTKANLVIRQGEAQGYSPKLYIEPIGTNASYEEILKQYFERIQDKYPKVLLIPSQDGWEVKIPETYKGGHESHFTQVTEKFIEYYKNGNMPEWEVPNMLAKYYTTTKALEIANKNQ